MQARTPKAIASERFVSSQTTIFQALMRNSFKKEVSAIGDIPPTNKNFRSLTGLYVKRTLIDIPATTGVEQLLDFADAGIGKLPKTDSTRELIARQGDLRKQLEERRDARGQLQDELSRTVTTQNKTMETILKQVAARPNAQEGNVVITKQIDQESKTLQNLSTKAERHRDQVESLLSAAHNQINFYSRVAGITISIPRSGDQTEISIARPD